MIAVPAAYVPLVTLAEHYGFVTRDYRLLIIAVTTAMAGYGIVHGLAYLGVAFDEAVDLVVVLLSGVALGRSLTRVLPGGVPGTVAALGAFLGALHVVRKHKIVHVAISWWVLFLGLGIVVAFGQAMINERTGISQTVSAEVGTLDAAEGDVVIVVFDEYPSIEFQDAQLGGLGSAVSSELNRYGFDVQGAMPVSYSFTEYVLPAFFMLDLPLREGDRLTETGRSELIGALGGRNPIVRAFKAAGYRVTMIESGWSGLRCMEQVDLCVVRSWYDEVTSSVVGRSLLAPLAESTFGHPFTHGTQRSVAWLEDELPLLLADTQKDFVFVHVMLPHTPLSFGPDCETRASSDQADVLALVEQVKCANAVVAHVAAITDQAQVVVIMGDHGSKSQGQVYRPPQEWTQDMVRERMQTLVATRGLDECPEPPAGSSVNVAVRLTRCLGGDVPYVDDVSLITSVRGEPLVNRYSP